MHEHKNETCLHCEPAPHNEHKKEVEHVHHNHHARMIADFKKRFFVSLILTVPILIFSPQIQEFMALK